MKLRLSLTRVFKEWKQADLIQNGQVIFVGHGLDIYWMPMMGLFLILPCICYRKTEKWFNAKYLIVFFAAELAGVLLFSKLVLVWLGFIAIM